MAQTLEERVTLLERAVQSLLAAKNPTTTRRFGVVPLSFQTTLEQLVETGWGRRVSLSAPVVQLAWGVTKGDEQACQALGLIAKNWETQKRESIVNPNGFLRSVLNEARSPQDLIDQAPTDQAKVKPKHLSDQQWQTMQEFEDQQAREEKFWSENDVNAYLYAVQHGGWDHANAELAAGAFRVGRAPARPE